MIRDYPQTKTQKATAERHADRRGAKALTREDERRIEEARAKRERRMRGAD